MEGGSQYNLVIIDDYYRTSWMVPLKQSDTKVSLKDWIASQENQADGKMKNIRSDNGGQYIDEGLEIWLRGHVIEHETILVNHPKATVWRDERMNRTL